MAHMFLHYVLFIFECAFSEGVVVFVVVPERLAEEVEAVEVVETFDVRGESAAVFGGDFYLVRC